ncbi:MAG: copper chaperone PCu(A)C [Gammaproteobacteria bacterium]|jgi:periplasmic copper chaperone A|nr:copper chaperone PCu(A)C [Gammaproteobacteria bacterium]
MTYMIKPLRNLSLIMLSLVFAPATAWAEPVVTEAWIPEAPPVSTVMAAFMTIHNNGDEDLKIVSVKSDQFAEVQMHLSVEEKGVAKMLPQKTLIVPARATLQLRQGSYHLMLFNSVSPLKAGDKVTLTLDFADGSKLPVIADVKKAGGMKSQSEHMKMKMDGSHRCY